MKLRESTGSLLVILWATFAGSAAAASGSGEGLRHAEIVAAHNLSQSVFSANRVERQQADAAGLSELGEALRRLKASMKRLRLASLSTPRVVAHGTAAVRLSPRPLHAASAEDFRQALAQVLTKKAVLRSRLPTLRAPRQLALARELLLRLDELGPSLTHVAAGPDTVGEAALDALARELGADRFAEPASATRLLEPTLTTRVAHRREISRAR